MSTFHGLRLDTITKHNTLIKELEAKYMSRIIALLQQKAVIHLQIQQSLYEQLNTIEINSRQLENSHKPQNRTIIIKSKEAPKKRPKPSQISSASETSKTVAFAVPHKPTKQLQLPQLLPLPPRYTQPIELLSQTAAFDINSMCDYFNKQTVPCVQFTTNHCDELQPHSTLTRGSNHAQQQQQQLEVIVVSDTEETDSDKLSEIKKRSREMFEAYGAIFCDVCNQQIDKKTSFYHCDKKQEQEHMQGFDICESCAHRQKRKEQQKSQTKSIKKWRCFYCNYSTNNKRDLDAHILVHNGNQRNWVCVHCGKTFIQKEHLEIHLKSHKHQEVFSCPRCSFVTNKKSVMNMHARYHLGEKPMQCTMCYKQYSCKQSLQNHIRSQHSTKPNDL